MSTYFFAREAVVTVALSAHPPLQNVSHPFKRGSILCDASKYMTRKAQCRYCVILFSAAKVVEFNFCNTLYFVEMRFCVNIKWHINK